ncbi:MAG: hypothetical protein WBF89_02005 [Steroidobacteraceae bacterium]
MKWRKIGKIFDPTEHDLPHNAKQFAQSPQTLVFDDFVRVYFSTRERDATGKYLSHVCYADFAPNLRDILQVCDRTVIELGGLGAFDEHGIFPVNVCRDGDRVLAYTTGWNRKVSVSADASIGLAISDDEGRSFKKIGAGPVLTSSLHEPFLVADAFVRKYGDTYHMWYIHGLRWTRFSADAPADRVYKIAHATSSDAISWVKEGRSLIRDKLDADECQALPTVIQHGDGYHMIFCYRQAHGFRTDPHSGYRLGYAYSDDLVDWVRDDSQTGIDVSSDGWDSQMQCYPHLFQYQGKIYLLYNGNEFGRAGFGLAELEA